MKNSIAVEKDSFELNMWDCIFYGSILLTVLSVNYLYIREIAQIIFIAFSIYNVRLKMDLVFEFAISRLLFLVWAALSFTWAIYPLVVIRYLFSVSQSTLYVVALVIYITYSEKNLKKAITIFVFSSMLLIVYLINTTPISQIMHANLTGAERITAGNINANQVGICCSYSILIVYWMMGKIYPVLSWILVSIFGFFSLITGSKKALITILVGLTILLILRSKDSFHCMIRIVLAIGMCAMIIWLIFNVDFLHETMGRRVEGLLEYLLYGTGDKSTYSRSAMIQQAKDVFFGHPILGIGLHNFKEINVYGVYAHNNYWELLVCLGIPGFLLYYVPIVRALINVVSGCLTYKNQFELVMVLLICFLINEYATVSYTNEVVQIVIALSIGMAFLYKQQVDKNER